MQLPFVPVNTERIRASATNITRSYENEALKSDAINIFDMPLPSEPEIFQIDVG